MADEQQKAPEASSAPEKAPEAAPPAPPAPRTFKSYGREFDISTDIGLAQLQVWTEAHESERGRLANKVGQLEKEVEPLRKYNLKNTTPDEIGLRKQVAELRDSGDHLAADNLLFEYARQTAKAADSQLERERMWADYKESRKEYFEALPEDMAKSYVFSNYSKEIEETEDPFGLIDRVLGPKVSKVRPAAAKSSSAPAEPELPAATLGAGSPPPVKTAIEPKKEVSAMDKVLEEFGFR